MTNFILHQWRGPVETIKWLCRQDNLWFEIPVNGGLGHTYHSLAWSIWHGGPSILLDALWTDERAPYILHSRDHDSRTVLFSAIWRQAWLATCGHEDRLQVWDPSIDYLVTRLISDGSDVHALDSLGCTPLTKALWYFVTYCDSSPLKALNFAHESREVFKIEQLQSENGNPAFQSGSRSDLYGSTNSAL